MVTHTASSYPVFWREAGWLGFEEWKDVEAPKPGRTQLCHFAERQLKQELSCWSRTKWCREKGEAGRKEIPNLRVQLDVAHLPKKANKRACF